MDPTNQAYAGLIRLRLIRQEINTFQSIGCICSIWYLCKISTNQGKPSWHESWPLMHSRPCKCLCATRLLLHAWFMVLIVVGDMYDDDFHPWQCQPIYLSLGVRKEINNHTQKEANIPQNEAPHASSTVPLCKSLSYPYQDDTSILTAIGVQPGRRERNPSPRAWRKWPSHRERLRIALFFRPGRYLVVKEGIWLTRLMRDDILV